MTTVPSELGVRIERGQRPRPVSTVAVRGDVDMITAPELKRVLTVQLAAGPPAVVVDLSGVSFMAVAGLRVLGQAFEAGAVRGIPVSLVVSSRAVRRPIELAGLDRLVPTHPSRASALSATGDDGWSACRVGGR